MTAPDNDPVRTFVAALPPRARQQLHQTVRITVLIHRALREHGWTVQQLVDECGRDITGVINPGGLVTFRLEQCADRPPPTASGPKRVHHGCCEDGWLYDETSDPPRQTKCPGNPAPQEATA